MSDTQSNTRLDRLVDFMYRFRWPIAAVALLSMFAFMGAGMTRVLKFSKGVDSLKEHPPKSTDPKMFDARIDIWFDKADPGLETYYRVEDEFIPEDTVLVAFEDKQDPWGVFGEKSLKAIDRLTKSIKQVPFVRHVRSLTDIPWIRWGAAGQDEEGLLVTDLFEKEPSTYSKDDRLQRMIAVMGARGAAKIAGEAEVRRVLGPNAKFDDYIGEPRLIGGIVSADGRTAALQVLVLRQKLTKEQIDKTFGQDPTQRAAGPSMYANESQWEALDQIQKLLAADKTYDYHVTGMPPYERNFQIVGMADMKWVGVMLLALGLTVFIMYRRLGAAGLPLLVVVAAIIGMNGAVWFKGDFMNNLTALLPHMIIAVGLGDAVHLVTSYYSLRGQIPDKPTLIKTVVRHEIFPIFICDLMTAVAFGTNVFGSSLVPMRQFGYTGALGVAFVFILSLTVIPAMLSLIPATPKKSDRHSRLEGIEDTSKPHWTDWFVQFCVKRRFSITMVSLAAVAFAVFGASRVSINLDFRTWFPKSNPIMKDLNWIEKRVGGSGDLEILFSAPASKDTPEQVRTRQARLETLQIKDLTHQKDATQPAMTAEEQAELKRLQAAEADFQRRRIATSAKFLASADRFVERLRKEMADPSSKLAIVTKIDSGLDILKKVSQVQNENQASFYRIPNESDVPAEARQPTIQYDEVAEEATLIPAQDASSLAAQYFIQYENGAKPVDNLSGLISPDRRFFRLAVRVDQAATTTHEAAFNRIREIARTEFPELAGTPEQVEKGQAVASMAMTGRLYMLANMADQFSRNLMFSMAIEVMAIIILFVLLFRSLAAGVIAIVPNVLPIAIPLTAFGLFGIMLDGPAVVISAIALGVAVDDTVHVMATFREARAAGLSLEDALRRSYRKIGTACTYRSIGLIVAFGVMNFSDFHPNIMIGRLACVMVAFAWIADFVVAPALLSYFYSGKETKATEDLSKVRNA